MSQISLPIVVAAVIGIAQWLKEKMQISGRPAEIVSFVVGVVCGGAYQVTMFPPVAASDWFGAAMVALLMGLVPSGLYKFGGQMADRIRGDGVIMSSGTIVTSDGFGNDKFTPMAEPMAIKKQ